MKYCLLLGLLGGLSWVLNGQATQQLFLSGHGKDDAVDWEFFIDSGRNSGRWTTIPVPSNWEFHGFGTFDYGLPDQPPSKETATYRYRFTTPAAWEGQAVRLVFEGVMTDTYVKVNGQAAGPVHQGGFYRFSFDVSSLLRYGQENQLEVQVKNHSDNASVNTAEREADYWIFGGIYRPVYLEAKPRQHIVRTAIDARADGSLRVDVFTANAAFGTTVEAQVLTMEGRAVGAPFSAAVARSSTSEGDSVTLRTRITDPALWSPEFPNRYRLQIRLGSQPLHQISETFGFRTVELRPHDGFYVNGRKIRFKGVNRHSFWPESGRCLSYELSVRDVELMKDMNMNAVRMSHYPPDVHFLDVCDSLGLFVLDELAGWQTSYDTTTARRLVRQMIIRDVNHPSIVIWDNGNEGGNNHAIDDDFARYDPQQRPLIHPWAVFRHTDTQHYKPWDCCAGTLFHGQEVFFPTEFLHGLYDGGHGAGLEDHWKLMRDNPLSAGGFLWVFSDEGVRRDDQDGRIDTDSNHAPDGILGPYREKEGSFFTIREIWSPVQLENRRLNAAFDRRLRVENNYHFTNLKDCRFDWQLVQFTGPESKNEKYQKIISGTTQSPDLAPGATGFLQLGLPENWNSYDALLLTVTDPHGRDLITRTFPIQMPGVIATRHLSTGGSQAASVAESSSHIDLGADGITVRIDRRTGIIAGVSNRQGKISFTGGPFIDSAQGAYTLENLEISSAGNTKTIDLHYAPAGDEGLRHYQLRYTMHPSGLLQIDYQFLPAPGEYDYLGIHFNYPEAKVKGIRWLGQGPYRVWKNRMKGPQLGIWEKAYNNTVTGESGWQYPEFKGYHAGLYWARIDTEEQPFVIAAATEGLFLRLFTPQPPAGAYNDHNDGIFPPGDISIMHAISPIGTKFQPARNLGPQGQKNQLSYWREPKLLEGRLFFDFRPQD